MSIRLQWLTVMIGLLCFSTISVARMQEQATTVPDLIGLNLPQATAALNRVGLALGNQTSEPWTEAASVPQNSISAQAVAAGETLEVGTPVDVTVLRSTNVSLIYDENDLTIINNTGGNLDFNGLVFGAAEGGTPAAFSASRWTGGLAAAGCAQIWSVIRSIPKDVPGCERVNHWLTTNNPAEHFWTALNGVSRFRIVQNGIERGNCPAAPAGTAPMTCDISLTVNANEGGTPYIYFAYTPQRLIIYNRSDNQFMRLVNTPVYNNNPNLTPPHQVINLWDSSLYQILNPVASTTRLAPGQCVLFTDRSVPESLETPEACEVIARLDLEPSVVFWTHNFDVGDETDGQTSSCNGAVAGQLTICVMPR